MNKLVSTLFTLSLIIGSTFSHAQWTQYRDQDGQPAGTSFTSGNTTQYRDASGAPAGSTMSSGGVTQAYGSDGAPWDLLVVVIAIRAQLWFPVVFMSLMGYLRGLVGDSGC